jgi:hypothetical protein
MLSLLTKYRDRLRHQHGWEKEYDSFGEAAFTLRLSRTRKRGK